MPYIGFEKVHRDLCYLSLRPTNTRRWHKAVFKVGPVAGPKPTRVRQGQKYLRSCRHSPFWGASGARQYPPKGVLACGDGPLRLKEFSSAEAHPAEPSRDKTAYRMQPNNWRGKKVRGPLNFSPPKPFSYERKGTPPLPRHINRKFFYEKKMT